MAHAAEPAAVQGAPPAPSRRPRRVRALVIAAGLLALVFAYGQWRVLPGASPFIGPALAVAGAALVTWLFADSLRRAIRRRRAGGRLPWLALALNAALFVLLVVSPLVRLPAALLAPPPGTPRVLSGFRDWLGAEGYPRVDGPHRGVDVAGRVGDPVLASAPGRVVLASDGGSCGLMIVVVHDEAGHRTIYCHLSAASVAVGDHVRRGDVLGAVGTSGMRPWPGYEHVHWMLQHGRHGPWLDPLARTVGCFDPGRAYPADRLVLTYPVRC